MFEVKDTPGCSPFGRTTDGGVSAIIFPTVAKAMAYAARLGHDGDWWAKELDVFDAYDWLENAKANNCVTTVWLDPNPADEGHKEMSVEMFLTMLDLGRKG